MACISYIKLWESEFDNIVSKRDMLQGSNIKQLELEVHDTYKKDERMRTKFRAVNDEDVINKPYLDEKISKMEGHLPLLEKKLKLF